jgi:hypothetical protein
LGAKDAPALLNGEPWRDGVRKIFEKMESVVIPTPLVARWRSRRSDEGDDIDAERFRLRMDKPWESMERPQVHGRKIVNIVVATSCPSGASADEYFWRGAAAVRLANAFVEAGYGVSITAVYHTDKPFVRGPQSGIVTVCLKAHDEPLDVERIAAWTGLPASNRWARFAHYESCEYRNTPKRGFSLSAASAMAFAPEHFKGIGIDPATAIVIDKHIDDVVLANQVVKAAVEKYI